MPKFIADDEKVMKSKTGRKEKKSFIIEYKIKDIKTSLPLRDWTQYKSYSTEANRDKAFKSLNKKKYYGIEIFEFRIGT
jgi:hypothetical protein